MIRFAFNLLLFVSECVPQCGLFMLQAFAVFVVSFSHMPHQPRFILTIAPCGIHMEMRTIFRKNVKAWSQNRSKFWKNTENKIQNGKV